MTGSELIMKLLAVALVLYVAAVQAQVVNIPKLGRVRGLTSRTAWARRTIYEYRGIYYAQTTSGDRRFKEALKVAPWTGVKNALTYGRACPQPGVSITTGDPEDCLSLDVYTPSSSTTSKFPVLVYFHGGAFISGSSQFHRPQYLLEQNIILVTPQYRLGALGFFQLNTADAPGNVGMLDQVMALQWVKDNIIAFGGDPNRVTIAGISSGGASVSLHMISPRSKGLFQQVIAQSGSALALWALDETEGEDHSRRVAEIAGCNASASTQDIVACMRKLPANETVKAVVTHSLMERRAGLIGMGVSRPTVQKKVEGVVPFLSSSPRQILESGNYTPVPLMMGVVKHEGIFTLDLSYQYYFVPNGLIENRNFFRDEVISNMLIMYEVEDKTRVMAEAVRNQYFKENDMGNFSAMIPSLVDFSGVALIRGPSIRQAELHSRFANTTYFYSFDYYGAQTSLSSANTTVPIKGGITHGDDTIYLFPRAVALNAADTVIAKRMVQLYANFIIYGNPTPKTPKVTGVPDWPKYDRDSEYWISLGETAEVYSDYRKTFTDAKDNGIQNKPKDLVNAVIKEIAYRLIG